MYETIGIAGKNYAIKLMPLRSDVVEPVVGRRSNDYFFLSAAALQHDDDIFLQYVIISKCTVPAGKQMDTSDSCMFEHEFSERAVVRAIAEASWDYCDKLPSVLQKREGESHKCGIQVYCFNTGLSQQLAVRGIAMDLLVWRIQDRVGILGLRGLKEPARNRSCGSLYKIFTSYHREQSKLRLIFFYKLGEIRMKVLVNFEQVRFNSPVTEAVCHASLEKGGRK